MADSTDPCGLPSGAFHRLHEKQKRRMGIKPRRWPRVLLIAAMVILLYVFSSGPLYAIHKAGLVTQPTFDALYWPLRQTCRLHPATTATLDSYLKLWAGIVG
jgi:hypothetical protein